MRMVGTVACEPAHFFGQEKQRAGSQAMHGNWGLVDTSWMAFLQS